MHLLLWLMWAAIAPASACVGGFMHSWQDLPPGIVGSSRVMTVTHLLRTLETRLAATPGVWGIALVDERLAPEVRDRIASAVAGGTQATVDRAEIASGAGGSSVTWRWSGCMPPFGSGDLSARIGADLVGMVWIDPVEIREESCLRLDPGFPGAIAVRQGWSSRAVYRVMACRRDGEIALIDELPIVTLFELDGLFPTALPLGGFWIRRMAWQDAGMERPQEVMFLPPFGFGQTPVDPGLSSGVASKPASVMPIPGP